MTPIGGGPMASRFLLRSFRQLPFSVVVSSLLCAGAENKGKRRSIAVKTARPNGKSGPRNKTVGMKPAKPNERSGTRNKNIGLKTVRLNGKSALKSGSNRLL